VDRQKTEEMRANIPLFKVSMAEDVLDGLAPVLKSGYIGQGPKVEEFEGLLEDFIGNPCCNTVNAGTSALHLALHLLKSDSEDSDRTEVLTTPLTCTATNFPIRGNGLDIKWVDVDPTTCNMDMIDLRRKIGPKTLAIMVVHWGGYPCDLSKIKDIQDECENLYGFRPQVIEDCAHAFGATYKGKRLGNHGNMCMFSFQAIKHITSGDGGLLVTPTYDFHRRARLLRWYGLDREKSPDMRCEQNVKEWGFKFHMNDINATIGIKNFLNINEILGKYQSNGNYYNDHLQGIPGVTLMENAADRESAFWIYTMRVSNRDGFVRKLKDAGISASKVHDRNDKHKCIEEYRSSLPGTDEICSDMICIPCGWWVDEDGRDHIVDTIKKGW
jgi:dTDP-4-amino-4,6-dideoxy-D-glucose/dTDP-4-amino-2,4-dideoxy-beta-L-xylose transaminase